MTFGDFTTTVHAQLGQCPTSRRGNRYHAHLRHGTVYYDTRSERWGFTACAALFVAHGGTLAEATENAVRECHARASDLNQLAKALGGLHATEQQRPHGVGR